MFCPLVDSVPLTSMTQTAAWTGDEEPWTNFNDSQLTPVIPNAIMWLVAEAEEVLRNDTWLDLDLALDMSRLQSVAYCHPPNVAAWNCTRQAPPEQVLLQRLQLPQYRRGTLTRRTLHKSAGQVLEHMINDEGQDHISLLAGHCS